MRTPARSIRLLAIVVCLGLLGAACSKKGTTTASQGGGKTVEGGVLRIAGDHIDTLNPFRATSGDSYAMFQNIYPFLIQYNDTYDDFVGDFATSWETSPDGKTWTFTVRSGAKWSDGQPLTAEDVAQDFKMYLMPGSGWGGTVKHITSVEAPDDTTVVIHYDAAVGNVLAKIRELGQEEATLIFFFSDNGGPTASTTSGNGPLRGFKAQTWEGGVRVPFMVQWKGKIPAGKVDDRPVIQLDIHPTALAAAGVEAKPEWKLDGVNLLPYLTGEKSAAPHDALYWRFGQQIALRKGDWKIVKGAGMEGMAAGRAGKADTGGAELYNLKEDIGEKNNLAAKNPEKLKELAAAWDKWNADNIEAAWEPGGGGKKGARAQKKKKGAAQ